MIELTTTIVIAVIVIAYEVLSYHPSDKKPKSISQFIVWSMYHLYKWLKKKPKKKEDEDQVPLIYVVTL